MELRLLWIGLERIESLISQNLQRVKEAFSGNTEGVGMTDSLTCILMKRRMMWLRHVCRMDDSYQPKSFILGASGNIVNVDIKSFNVLLKD